MEQFASIHLFMVYFLALCELLYACFVLAPQGNLHRYIWRIRTLLPAYYLAIACVFFTGILMAAAESFAVPFLRRSGLLLAILVLSIYEFVLFKRARRKKDLAGFKKRASALAIGKLALFAAAWL